MKVEIMTNSQKDALAAAKNLLLYREVILYGLSDREETKKAVEKLLRSIKAGVEATSFDPCREAAPELLAALKTSLDLLPPLKKPSVAGRAANRIEAPFIERAEFLVAKAEGRVTYHKYGGGCTISHVPSTPAE